MLADRLERAGLDVLRTREPGGTSIGDRLRGVLLDPAHHGEVEAVAELFMYEAARAQLTGEVIRPALARGAVVVCDRFSDSTTAYQGYGRELDLGDVLEANRLASGGLEPDLTIVLDIDPVLGLARATGQGADRLEREDLEFHRRVRAGYLTIAAIEPARVVVVDASGGADEVAERVWAAASPWLGAFGVPV